MLEQFPCSSGSARTGTRLNPSFIGLTFSGCHSPTTSKRTSPPMSRAPATSCSSCSVDDKGQLYLHIKALEAHLKTRGTLPVNVIVLAEGEEEVGSEHLVAFIEANKDVLACDAVVISDSSMFAPGLPSILSSLRG